jgi:hypothetical protein
VWYVLAGTDNVLIVNVPNPSNTSTISNSFGTNNGEGSTARAWVLKFACGLEGETAVADEGNTVSSTPPSGASHSYPTLPPSLPSTSPFPFNNGVYVSMGDDPLHARGPV